MGHGGQPASRRQKEQSIRTPAGLGAPAGGGLVNYMAAVARAPVVVALDSSALEILVDIANR